MALLDVTPEQLLLLRNAIDGNMAWMLAHEKVTDDPYIAAAIHANTADYIALRQHIVKAMKPAPWPARKQSYDDMQSGDGLAYAVICIKHGEPNCRHCAEMRT